MGYGAIIILVLIILVILGFVVMGVVIKVLSMNLKIAMDKNKQLEETIAKNREFLESQNKIIDDVGKEVNNINATDNKNNNSLLNSMYPNK